MIYLYKQIRFLSLSLIYLHTQAFYFINTLGILSFNVHTLEDSVTAHCTVTDWGGSGLKGTEQGKWEWREIISFSFLMSPISNLPSTWKSTYCILHLYEVQRQAKAIYNKNRQYEPASGWECLGRSMRIFWDEDSVLCSDSVAVKYIHHNSSN